jgi:hypothetical protein
MVYTSLILIVMEGKVYLSNPIPQIARHDEADCHIMPGNGSSSQ